MKKALFGAMLALAGVMIVGCAGNKADGPGAAIMAWQAERYNAAEIAAANEAARPLTLEDVLYKSTITQPELAAPINALATVPAALYLKVVTEVDQLAATQDGRLVYLGVQNDLANGAKWEDLVKTMKETPVKDKDGNPTGKTDYDCYVAYQKSIAQVDQQNIIDTVVMPMIAKLTEESARVAVTVAAVKDNPVFQALAGFELMKAGKNLAEDGKKLSGQFADATAGANHWLYLLNKDKEAKELMKDYPVE